MTRITPQRRAAYLVRLVCRLHQLADDLDKQDSSQLVIASIMITPCSLLIRYCPCRLHQLADGLDEQGTKVVLLKVHLEAPVHGDLARSLQALAMEVMEAGYHFYILLHVSQFFGVGVQGQGRGSRLPKAR